MPLITTEQELERGTSSEGSAAFSSPSSQTSKYQQLANKHSLTLRSVSSESVSNDLSFSQINFRAGDKQILSNCWGDVKSETICGVMGPSGSGKSSLLNVLAGRSATVDSIRVDGNVLVGGKPINPVAYRKNIAYVMQEDSLMATATPREAIRFSAAMRLPGDIDASLIDELVEALLEDLGLVECAEVMIGGAMIKGISGGQKKRTSVGVELVTSPTLLFLDEPTSGLDSTSATSLVNVLKQMASNGTTIMCTIHQPSSQIFLSLDQVIFLKAGRIFFSGTPAEISPHFSKMGMICPLNYNPSDFLMTIVQTETVDSATEKNLFMEVPPFHLLHKASPSSPTEALLSFVTSDTDSIVVERSFFRQMAALIARETVNTKRDIGALIGRFGVTIFLNILFGLIFQNAAGRGNKTNEDINSHFGAVTMVVISGMFGAAQPVMLSIPFERPMFLREYTTGTYGAIPYFLSKLVPEIPLVFLQTVVQVLIVYFLIDFQGDFWMIVGGVFGLAMAACSVGVALGCSVNDVKDTTELAPLLFVPQMLFVGFFVPTQQIPVFLRWCQYLCGLKYGMNIIMLTEFDPDLSSCDGPIESVNCNTVLENNQIYLRDWWIYVVMLFVLFFALRLLGAIILVQRSKRFY